MAYNYRSLCDITAKEIYCTSYENLASSIEKYLWNSAKESYYDYHISEESQGTDDLEMDYYASNFFPLWLKPYTTS